MSSRRAARRRACEGKVRYPNRDAAQAATTALYRDRPWERWVAPYQCRFCGGFHLGHAPARIRRAVNAKKREARS